MLEKTGLKIEINRNMKLKTAAVVQNVKPNRVWPCSYWLMQWALHGKMIWHKSDLWFWQYKLFSSSEQLGLFHLISVGFFF